MREHGTKATPVLLFANREASWLLLPIWPPYYQVAQCNQKSSIPYPQGDRSGLRKPKKYKH